MLLGGNKLGYFDAPETRARSTRFVPVIILLAGVVCLCFAFQTQSPSARSSSLLVSLGKPSTFISRTSSIQKTLRPLPSQRTYGNSANPVNYVAQKAGPVRIPNSIPIGKGVETSSESYEQAEEEIFVETPSSGWTSRFGLAFGAAGAAALLFFKGVWDRRQTIVQRASSVALAVAITTGFQPAALAEGEPKKYTPPVWGYGGVNNPTYWGTLQPNYMMCEAGTMQSPININNITEGAPTRLTFNYKDTPLVIDNNNNSIKVIYEPGSYVSINGKKAQLLQFHFHTPSEHQYYGKAAAMEGHLVHKTEEGKLVVVGVFIKDGNANPVIKNIMDNVGAKGQTKTVEGVTINGADLLPSGRDFYTYEGSLTTPPCSEGVRWIVMMQPITSDVDSIQAFENFYPLNARPPQSRNNRSVTSHTPPAGLPDLN